MILSCSACWSLYYTHELLALLCFAFVAAGILFYLVVLTVDLCQMSVEFSGLNLHAGSEWKRFGGYHAKILNAFPMGVNRFDTSKLQH